MPPGVVVAFSSHPVKLTARLSFYLHIFNICVMQWMVDAQIHHSQETDPH